MGYPAVIHPKCLPTKLPVTLSLVMWLVLERLHAPGWVMGAAGAVGVIVWIGTVFNMIREHYVRPDGIEGHE